MPKTHDVIFLFDVDDTLLDNDAMKDDLGAHVLSIFGKCANDRFWALYEEERIKHSYADFLGTLERFRLENMHDPRVLGLANWLLDYPYTKRLYPGALDVVQHVRAWGLSGNPDRR